MSDVINPTKVFQDDAKSMAADCLFDDTITAKFDSFKPASQTNTESGYLTMSSVFTNDKLSVKDEIDSESLVSFKKGGRHCELLDRIVQADRAVHDDPLLDRKIDKQSIALAAAQKDAAALTAKIRAAAADALSKQDWADLSGLGKLPFGLEATNKCGEIPINLNNAQRAWLKENHPQIYQMVEKHDQASLTETRAAARLNALEQVRDQPVAARLDFAAFQQNMGNTQAAIDTLTEVARLPRSSAMQQSFRDAAVSSGAAWDKVFRKAIESAGGNILDYVERPRPSKLIKDLAAPFQLREAIPAADAQLKH